MAKARLTKRQKAVADALRSGSFLAQMDGEMKMVEAHAMRGEYEKADEARARAHEALDQYLDTKIAGLLGAVTAPK